LEKTCVLEKDLLALNLVDDLKVADLLKAFDAERRLELEKLRERLMLRDFEIRTVPLKIWVFENLRVLEKQGDLEIRGEGPKLLDFKKKEDRENDTVFPSA
jgi:hypothetical protein